LIAVFISFTAAGQIAKAPVTIHFGVWSYQFWTFATSVEGSAIFQTCHRYPSSISIDSYGKAARAFGTLALIVGGIFLFANLISACISPSRKTSRLEAPAFLLACFFQGMAFLVLRSSLCNDNALVAQFEQDVSILGKHIEFPDTCSLSVGGKCTIAAVVFWFVAALTSGMSVRSEKLEEENNAAAITEPLIPGENL